MRRSFLALSVLPLLAAAACSVYDSSLLGPANTGGGSGTGNSSGSGGGGAGSGGSGGADCELATYPPRPVDPPEGTRDVDFVVVMDEIDFGDSEPNPGNPPTRYRGIGFDLDRDCTDESEASQMAPNRCILPPRATGVVDGPGGRDNALGTVIQYVRDRVPTFSSEQYSTQLKAGETSVLIRVSGYNGEPNDGKVKVETWVTAPFSRDPGNGETPEWKGRDAFPIASTSVEGGVRERPRFVSNNAYVTDNRIVASLASIELTLDVGLSDIQQVELGLVLFNAYVVCTIEPSELPGGYRLKDCTLAAKWKADDLVKQLSHFPDPLRPNEAVPLCTKSSSYPAFKQAICSLVDTYSTGDIGPTTECESISMGVLFQTAPALLGSVVQVTKLGEQCTAEQGQTELDNCQSFYDGSGGTPGTGGAATSTGGAAATGGQPGSGGTIGTGGSGGTSGVDAGEDAGDSGTSDASVN